MLLVLYGWIQKIIVKTHVKEISPKFSSRSLMVLGIMFKTLNHFELIFVSGVREEYTFILLYVDIQFSQHHLLKGLSFLYRVFLAPLSNIN